MRKRPTPLIDQPMLSSLSSSNSSMRSGGKISRSRLSGASGGKTWLLMGTHRPLMRIVAGECTDKYTSDARFSAINRRIRSMVPLGVLPVVAMCVLLG